MVSSETIFTNARLVLEDEVVLGSICVRGGVITEVNAGSSRVAGQDLQGDLLLPGLVELHTDHFEKQLMPRADVPWPAMSALLAHDAQLASAGITTVFDAVAIGDSHDKPERAQLLTKALDAVQSAREHGALRAEHWIHIRCEVGHPETMSLFEQHGSGDSVKLVSLMDHTPGARQYADVERFRDHVAKSFGRTSEELDAFIAVRQRDSERYAAKHREAIAAEAKRRGIVLASHDDATPAHIDEAVGLGVAIAEFPTSREAAQAAHEKGLTTVLGAPNVVRGGSHSGNVVALDLARAGLLDALSSDYMPISLIEAPFRLSREADMALPAAIALVTRNPAAMVGFEDRGVIAPARRADLVRVREISAAPVVTGVWRQGRRVA